MWSVVLTLLLVRTCSSIPDPCTPGNHMELNQPQRSTGNIVGPTDEALCDIGLQEGWYRFTSLAGGKLPDHCVGQFHCGTHAPIWLNGTHPDVTDGMVDRVACANFGGTGRHPEFPCCDTFLHIGVKNCAGFYVYYLKPTPNACPVAYCAGTKTPCPKGQTSPTGLEPCLAVPDKPPTLAGPEIVGQSFRFTCNADFPHANADTVLDVVWTFDGKEDSNIPHSVIVGNSGKATLPGTTLRDHMGTNVGCKIRPMSVTNRNLTGNWTESNTYWAGIRPDPDILEVSEKEGPRNITLTSTVPLVCDHDRSCCLTIVLDVLGEANNVAMPDACHYQLCSTDWNNVTHQASVTIPVIATRDQIKDGNKTVQIRFHELLSAGGGPYLAAFDHHQIQPVKVIATDGPTQSCTWSGDPHIHGMEHFGTFHLFDVGDYTMYQNPHRHFEVQARTWRCGSVSCICGVVIREGNNVVRIDQCDQHSGGRHTSPRVTTPRRLSSRCAIHRSRDGHQIHVTMPSGFEMKVNANPLYLDTSMVVPSTDHGAARGVCGTWDGNSHNEFTHRNGYVDPHPQSVPQQFTNSWKNTGSDSLFHTVPQEVLKTNETRYCSCAAGGSGTGQPTVDCTKDAVTPTQRLQCTGTCQDVTNTTNNNLPPFLQGGGWAKRSAAPVYADYDEIDTPFDPSQFQGQQKDWSRVAVAFPTASGITEQEARKKCLEEMMKSQLWSHCQHNTQMKDNTLKDCVTDVLYSDSFDFLASASSSITTECHLELSNDPSNYVTSPDGKMELKAEFSSEICSHACLQNGRCVGGQCVCNAGFTGESCQLEAGKGPQLDKLRGSNLCDLTQKPCRKVYFDASNFEASDTFHCAIYEVQPDGTLSTTQHTEAAELLTSFRLACPLPDTQGRSVTKFAVSVTSDGVLYSNTMNITVYDSTCRDCTQQDCPQITNTCLINEHCHQDGDLNPADMNQVCLPSNSTNQWTGPAPGAFPKVTTPVVKLESGGDVLRCSFSGATSPDARYRIIWFIGRNSLESGVVTEDQQPAAGLLTSELVDPDKLVEIHCGVCPFYVGQTRCEDQHNYKFSLVQPILVA